MGNAININKLIKNMAADFSSLGLESPIVIGIHTGGVWVAERLHKALDLDSQLGTLDISFYRDDFSRVGLNPEVRSSELPESIEDRNVILIDDVLYTGRTIRAAMNEIFSYGRPSTIHLGVLIDRGDRELPIQPDVSGHRLELASNQQAKLEKKNNKLSINIGSTS